MAKKTNISSVSIDSIEDEIIDDSVVEVDDVTIEVVADDADAADVVADEPVAAVEAPKPSNGATTHIVADGDTYAALGAIYAPNGVSGHEHAQALYDLNGGKALVIGSEIRLG